MDKVIDGNYSITGKLETPWVSFKDFEERTRIRIDNIAFYGPYFFTDDGSGYEKVERWRDIHDKN